MAKAQQNTTAGSGAKDQVTPQTPQGKNNGKRGGKEDGAGTDPSATKQTGKKPRKADNPVSTALRMKSKYSSVITATTQLLNRITTDPAFKKINNDTTLCDMKEARSALETVINHSVFAQQIITMELGDVKKKFDETQKFEDECNKFNVAVEPLVAKLEVEVKIILAMQKGSAAVKRG